jgi:phosphatidylserine/phosphatidylglycerophosphate/cardiolipin synthase-like enzyme/uncharacterized membrane protein YdjX (TVP38/TMEM64 family)
LIAGAPGGAPSESWFRPGVNCWRCVPASKVAFLIDGENYFTTLHEAMQLARRSIYVVGWDIDSRMRLLRDGRPGALPVELSDLIDGLVSRRPELEVRILTWDSSWLFAFEREWLTRYRLGWRTTARVQFELDAHHPFGASQHQKLVVIDDSLAFVGGLDLTQRRWDTRQHAPREARRTDPSGESYGPFHDVQIAMAGPVAASLGELARWRWAHATENEQEPVGRPRDLWPASLESDLGGVDVAIARTWPTRDGSAEIREVERLYRDSIREARHAIYIENQYTSSDVVAEALEPRLRDPRGPEVIVVCPRAAHGWLERSTIDRLRRRFLERLRRADRCDRLRVFHPTSGDRDIYVHAKVMVIDDTLVRVGSSNLTNRSMGFDSECDVAIRGERDRPDVRGSIRAFRDDLIAEHLGVESERVRAAVRDTGSVRSAIDRLQSNGERNLSRLRLEELPSAAGTVERNLVDPDGTEAPARIPEELVPSPVRREATRTGWWRIIATVAVLVALVVLWRWTPLADWAEWQKIHEAARRVADLPLAPVVATLVFVAATLVAFPITVLIAATVIVFGPWIGFACASLGSVAGAAAGYGIGRRVGRPLLRRFGGRRVHKLGAWLKRRGLASVTTVRVVPVAPFTVINLVAGASGIRFRDYVWGTVLGMMPGIAAISIFADRAAEALREPSPGAVLTVVVIGSLLVGGVLAARSWLRGLAPRGQESP